MSTQSKVASTRRKSKPVLPISPAANVIHIDPKRREEKNMIAYRKLLTDYLNQFTEAEQDIALGFARLMLDKAHMIRRSKPESSEVIPFPTVKNHQSKSVMEA